MAILSQRAAPQSHAHIKKIIGLILNIYMQAVLVFRELNIHFMTQPMTKK